MKLSKLILFENYKAPGYHGTIEVQGSEGKIECNIAGEHARKLVEVMAESLAKTAADIAAQLADSMAKEFPPANMETDK